MSGQKKRSIQDYEICAFLNITADDLVSVRSSYPETYRALVRAMLNVYEDGDTLVKRIDAFFDVLSKFGEVPEDEFGGDEW